jgi:hypothetical protein
VDKTSYRSPVARATAVIAQDATDGEDSGMNIDWGALAAIGALATPLVVLVLGYLFTKKQSRSEGLLNARFEYYERLAPQLNTLMCYVTFIGDWSRHSPADVVEMK